MRPRIKGHSKANNGILHNKKNEKEKALTWKKNIFPENNATVILNCWKCFT